MKHMLRNILLVGFALGLLIVSAAFMWVATLEVPTLDGFDARQITQSTKIYDRTGEVLLFDLNKDVRRTVVPFEEISRNLKNATIAIEDAEFYEHKGVRPKRTLKAIYDNVTTGSLLGGQGGSTITQQVVKLTLLTSEKKISRKVKEWILALRLEQLLGKDEILELYLNEVPYGGNIYGAEEASQYFFAVSARDLSLVQAAYLAALPQAPSRYSPYGNNIDLLENRKNQVLSQMLNKGFISDSEYREARNEKVTFEQYGDTNIKAPHFVFFVQEYLEEKYGRDAIYEGGLKVITTLNYELQKIGEEVVGEFALSNEENFDAENAALVAIDPKTGQILTMVGSRNYFDEDIDGKFNITTAYRQPGSTFKPIVYATAFEKGYTPETVVFDVPTQFSTTCEPNNLTTGNGCYSPVNYDGVFRGPMTLRNALAQSINIPAVKTLYLVGVKNAIQTAEKLGIQSLTEGINYYGLPLVLGGGEVSPLEITNAYATLANDGVYNPYTAILRVEDASGTVLEEYKKEENPGERAISTQAARLVTSVLTDIDARTPAYGQNSFSFGRQQVAVKTGTTNNFRDVWIMGYTPNIAVGTWGGNNDNSPIVKKVAGFVLAPLWRAYMDRALTIVPFENFEAPDPEQDPESLKPVLRGFWQGTAVASTTPGFSAPGAQASIHSILYWVNKDNPRGSTPDNPASDPQYNLWEYAVQKWAQENVPQLTGGENILPNTPGDTQLGGTEQNTMIITNPRPGQTYRQGQLLNISVASSGTQPLTSVEYYLNNAFMGSSNQPPFSFSIVPDRAGSNTLRVVGRAGFVGKYESQVTFVIQ
jgi:1A family penicillin-binding protein